MTTKPRISVQTHTLRIVEHTTFWRVHRKDHTADYPTAAEALDAVWAFAKTLAEDKNISSMLVIDWEPTTHVGHCVVRALAPSSYDV